MKRILYLHGFASGPASKKARFFAGRLAEMGAALEVPDLSAGNFENLTIGGQLRVVEEAARGEAVSLIGSSLGGYLAALYAARHPEVEKLVLLAPAFCFPTRWPEVLGPQKMEEWRRTGKLPVFHYGAGAMRDLGLSILEESRQYEDYPAFTQPALIFHGSQDDVVPLELSRSFAGAHKNAGLCILNSNHELIDVLETIWTRTRTFLFDELSTYESC